MNDQQILGFIQTRPDFRQYYFGTMVPQMGYENSDAGLIQWVKQHISDGNDQGAFQQYLNSTGQTAGGDLNFNTLVNPTLPNAGSPTIPPGPEFAGGGNYNQTQLGGQTGAYSSTGATAQQQTGTQNLREQQQQQQQQQTTQQQVSDAVTRAQQQATTDQRGTTSQVGTTDQRAAETSTGVTTSTPLDFMGLTEAVRGQIGATRDQDAANAAFLANFRDTGGTAFQSQVDQAIRNSLTGPLMNGAGDSSRARMGAYAAEQIARNNAGQRLQAAELLQRPSAVASTVGAVSPLIGRREEAARTGQTVQTGTSAQTGTSTNVGTTNTVGQTQQTGQVGTTGTTSSNLTGSRAQDVLDFQSLVGREAQQGVASGQSTARGFGQVPEGQPVKTGGCVVCTAYVERGEMKPGAVRRAVEWKLRQPKYRLNVIGYLAFGHLLARAVLYSNWFARTFRSFARAILYHEVHLSAPTRVRWRLGCAMSHGVFLAATVPVGALMSGRHNGVTDNKILNILYKNNLAFEV